MTTPARGSRYANFRARFASRSRTLIDMSYIPTLVASLDTRLDELIDEISTLEHARAALRNTTLAAPTAVVDGSAKGPRPARSARQTKRAEPVPRPAGIDPKPESGATAVVSSLSAEELERLLADAGSGLSAGAIAEQTGVSYSRVLGQLRAGEAAGQVRRTGRRRSTLWSLMTDEERVAQRAAELERLVGARGENRTQRRGRARTS